MPLQDPQKIYMQKFCPIIQLVCTGPLQVTHQAFQLHMKYTVGEPDDYGNIDTDIL